jgi:chromosome segregation ATPase
MRLSSDFRGTIFLSSGGAIVPLKSSSIYHLTPTGLFTQNGPQWVEVISVSNPLGEMPPLPPLQQNIVPQTQVSETLQPERTSPSEGGQQFSKTMDTQPSYEDPEQKQRELEEWTRGLKHMEIRLTQMEQRLNVLNRQKQEIQRKIYRTQSLVRTSGNASSLQSRLIFFRRRKRMLEKEYREIQEEMRDSRQSVIQARNHIEQLKTN